MKSYVLITGAAGGLGRRYCHECAARGWDLFLTDVSSACLDELARELEKRYGINVKYLAGDFLTAAARDSFFSSLRALDVLFHFLINVAGVEFEAPFGDQSLEQIRMIMNVNMNGTIEMTSQVLPMRHPERTFRILTVSSLAYIYPMPYKAIYSSSKRFLYQFFTALREELRDDDVSITLLCPAGMPTKQAVIDRIKAQGRIGELTTVAPEKAVKLSIDAALRGDADVIPGAINRFLRFAGNMMSESHRAQFLKKRWDRSGACIQTDRENEADSSIPGHFDNPQSNVF